MDKWDADAARHEGAPYVGFADDLPTGIIDGIAEQPEDFESIPYQYDPAVDAWVKMIK
jgi:hypothetical protein